jgi:hypothetical protein
MDPANAAVPRTHCISTFNRCQCQKEAGHPGKHRFSFKVSKATYFYEWGEEETEIFPVDADTCCRLCGGATVAIGPNRRLCISCGEVWTIEGKRPKDCDLLAVEVQGAE